MSNYANIDFEVTNIRQPNIVDPTKHKHKFVISDSVDSRVVIREHETKADMIDYETNLLTPAINSKDKTQMKLNNDFNPDNFDIIYSNGLNTKCNQKTNFYYTNKDGGAGRGFGNLNISNEIRYSDASRNNTKELKQRQESLLVLDYQYQYLDRNVQNPNNLIMPIPRGGESTRKQNQLSVNSMRANNDDYAERIKSIKFEY